MPNDPKQMVKAEVRARLKAERDFLSFCKYVDPKHPTDAAHVKLLARKLEQVARYILTGGKEGINRLMIFMPPRYWKSQTASRKFPAWLLGKNPNLRIIMTSYNADLATKHSKAVRDLIMSDEYSQVFGALASTAEPVLLDRESKASAAWDIANHHGGMLAAGVGGGITGFGANLLIIDDPVRGRKDASSETMREDIYEWYRSTAYTRLEDHGAVVVIQTRWDVEDLSGQLLRAMASDLDADQWDVVFMPAIALEESQYPKTQEEFVENLLGGIYIPMGGDQLGRKPGQPLWPQKHDENALRIIKANMDKADATEFSAQYQQLPRLAQGNFFDEEDFQIVDRVPDGLRWVRYSDLALGNTTRSDFNACYAVALGEDGTLYVRDPIKKRNLDEFLADVKLEMLSDREFGTRWGFEDVAFQILVFKQMIADPRLARVVIEPIKPNGSKEDRARSWRGRAKSGKVALLRGSWNLDFKRVATAFPKGRYDDDVDSISGGVQMIAEDGGPLRTASAPAAVIYAESLFEGVYP
jgi:predicted phage terminase large subunit-like protein